MLFWFTGLVVLVVAGWLVDFAESAGCWCLMVVWRILIWYCCTGLWFVGFEVWWCSCLVFVLMLVLISGDVLVMLALLFA